MRSFAPHACLPWKLDRSWPSAPSSPRAKRGDEHRSREKSARPGGRKPLLRASSPRDAVCVRDARCARGVVRGILVRVNCAFRCFRCARARRAPRSASASPVTSSAKTFDAPTRSRFDFPESFPSSRPRRDAGVVSRNARETNDGHERHVDVAAVKDWSRVDSLVCLTRSRVKDHARASQSRTRFLVPNPPHLHSPPQPPSTWRPERSSPPPPLPSTRVAVPPRAAAAAARRLSRRRSRARRRAPPPA